MVLTLKFPVLFKNKDVQFLKDALILATAEMNNIRVVQSAEKESLNAVSHEVRTLAESINARLETTDLFIVSVRDRVISLENAVNSLKSPETDEIGRKIDELSSKIEKLAVAVHDYAKIEEERAKINEDETVLRLGGLE